MNGSGNRAREQDEREREQRGCAPTAIARSRPRANSSSRQRTGVSRPVHRSLGGGGKEPHTRRDEHRRQRDQCIHAADARQQQEPDAERSGDGAGDVERIHRADPLGNVFFTIGIRPPARNAQREGKSNAHAERRRQDGDDHRRPQSHRFPPLLHRPQQEGHAADRRDAGQRLHDAERRRVIARLLEDPGGDQSTRGDAAKNGRQHRRECLRRRDDELQHQAKPDDFEAEGSEAGDDDDDPEPTRSSRLKPEDLIGTLWCACLARSHWRMRL